HRPDGRRHLRPRLRRPRLGAVGRRAPARRRHARADGARAGRAAGRSAHGSDRRAAVPLAAEEDGVSAAPLLEAEDVRVEIGGVRILHGAFASVEAGRLVAIVGPNGAGKSTFARACAGIQRTCGGRIRLAGQDVATLRGRRLARLRAFVPQRARVPEGMTVRQAVQLGRSPHLGPLRRAGRRDQEAVERAMERTGVAELADRNLTTLSGGELQRAQISIALAQEAPLLILDEPTAHLDLGATVTVARLLRELADAGLGVLLVVHDL